MASPKSGSDGSGYIYAKSFGHTVKKPLPALTALMAEANWLKETTGVRADATVKLYVVEVVWQKIPVKYRWLIMGFPGFRLFR